MRGATERSVRRVAPGGAVTDAESDALVVEEPLEIRVAGEPLVLTMRTPGRDEDLAVGLLFAEGVIESIDDVGAVVHCGRPDEEGFGNVIDVTPGPGVVLDPERLASSRRGTLTTAACGVCGRRSIDDLLARTGPLPPGPDVPLALVAGSTDRLREVQPTFDRTGGIHAALALASDGARLASAEDVGRHNAVDKVLGHLLRTPARNSDHVPFADVLVVSGRISFEIVQKAAVGRIPIVTGVSAPTSLAVDLAERLGITLAGFVRGGALTVYAHPERIAELARG